MAETRTVTIEASPVNTLYTWRVKVDAEVVDKFVRVATDERGPWRKKETFHQALEGAVTAALFQWLAEPFTHDVPVTLNDWIRSLTSRALKGPGSQTFFEKFTRLWRGDKNK